MPHLERWLKAPFHWPKLMIDHLRTTKTAALSKQMPSPERPKVFDAECQLEMAFDVCAFLRPETTS